MRPGQQKHEPDGFLGCLCHADRNIFLWKKNLIVSLITTFQLWEASHSAIFSCTSKHNWLFTVKQLTNSSWTCSTHHDTSSSMLLCGRDAFIIVFLIRSSKAPLRCITMQLVLYCIHHYTTLLNHLSSYFPTQTNSNSELIRFWLIYMNS